MTERVEAPSQFDPNTPRLGRHINDKKSLELFYNVVFIIDNSLSQRIQTKLSNLLLNNGGTAGNPEYANVRSEKEKKIPNLFISDLKEFQSNDSMENVTPLWVEKAVLNGFVHETKYYSPIKHQILSGEVLLLLDLPDEGEGLNQAILKKIVKCGGQYRNDLTNDITCLTCLDPRGAFYKQCIKERIPVVLPQWLDDCFRYEKKMDYEPYCFPDPTIWHQHNAYPPKIFRKPDLTLLPKYPQEYPYKSLQDHVIYFGSDVTGKDDIMPLIVDLIEKAGGRVAREYDRHEVTIAILRHRTTHECNRAYRDNIEIASFWWLTNTLRRGYWCSPLCTLIDFPIPSGGIPGMQSVYIAILGYGKVAREYLRHLIVAIGAKLCSIVDDTTTHVICAGTGASKYDDVVNSGFKFEMANHLWIEDCYTKWEIIALDSDERYTFFPQDPIPMNKAIGRASLDTKQVKLWMKDKTAPESEYKFRIEGDVKMDEAIQYGSVNIRQPRKAAMNASRVLNDIIIPDVNAYEKEIRSRSLDSKK